MNKKERYNINNPKSKLFKLNENEKDTKTINALTKKYGKDIVLFWLTHAPWAKESPIIKTSISLLSHTLSKFLKAVSRLINRWLLA